MNVPKNSRESAGFRFFFKQKQIRSCILGEPAASRTSVLKASVESGCITEPLCIPLGSNKAYFSLNC